jgi:hypothetical protein
VLAKPIVAIADAAKIEKHLSPYFMRRTFQDLCRAAQVHDFVARSISGHATPLRLKVCACRNPASEITFASPSRTSAPFTVL